MVAAGEIYQEHGVWTRKPLGDLHIPRTVEDAVQSRARTLGAEELRLLELAAVMGRRFIDAQLVAEESAEHFSFRHAALARIRLECVHLDRRRTKGG